MTDPSRRQFLGAAAALAALPAASTKASAARVDSSTDDLGNTRHDVEPGEPVFGIVDLHGQVDDGARLSVSGFAYPDDDGDESCVECNVGIGNASVTLNLSPGRAREFAEELQLAAKAAEQGGDRDE